MSRLTVLMLAFTLMFAASCQKKASTSNVLEFKSDVVEVEPYSPYSFEGTDQWHGSVFSNIGYAQGFRWCL